MNEQPWSINYVCVLWTSWACLCRCIICSKVSLHEGCGQRIGWSFGRNLRCFRWKCFFKSPVLQKDLIRFNIDKSCWLRQKMHCVGRHFNGNWISFGEKMVPFVNDGSFTSALIACRFGTLVWQFSWQLARDVKVPITLLLRAHSSLEEAVAKIKNELIASSLSLKTYTWSDSETSLFTLFPPSCCFISTTGCFFIFAYDFVSHDILKSPFQIVISILDHPIFFADQKALGSTNQSMDLFYAGFEVTLPLFYKLELWVSLEMCSLFQGKMMQLTCVNDPAYAASSPQ